MFANLHIACVEGLDDIVSELLEIGESPNQYNEEGFTPLCLASFWGRCDITRQLLLCGADVNLPNEGTLMTAAHAAAFQGYGKILMILIEYGANLQTRDKYDNSTVDYASANDAIWPLFANEGYSRTAPEELAERGICHQHDTNEEFELDNLCRPQTAYRSTALQDHHHAAGDVLGDEHVAAPSEPPFGAQSLWQ